MPACPLKIKSQLEEKCFKLSGDVKKIFQRLPHLQAGVTDKRTGCMDKRGPVTAPAGKSISCFHW